VAVPVVAMLAIEGLKVELVDNVEEEPGQMILGQPVAQARGQQEGLVAIAAKEVVRHEDIVLLRHRYTKYGNRPERV
jgi:hypothetical protein